LQRGSSRSQTGTWLASQVVSEVAGSPASREEQVIERRFTIAKSQDSSFEIDPVPLAQQHGDVALSVEDRPDRRGDVCGRQAGHRDLVQQRLKQAVVRAIDACDKYGCLTQRFRCHRIRRPR